MGLSCLIFALICGAASLIIIPLAVCLCLCCIGFTAAGIRGGSAAADCMACGGGTTPACVSCGQSVGAAGLPCSILVGIFMISTVVVLYNCQSATDFYCQTLAIDKSRCFFPKGAKESPCFTFFGKGYCEEELKPVYCSQPIVPPGMVVKFPDQDHTMEFFPVNALAVFSCQGTADEEFPDAFAYSFCKNDGTWDYVENFCDSQLVQEYASKPGTCFCDSKPGYIRHSNGSCALSKVCSEEQNGCATFEQLVVHNESESTCINTKFKTSRYPLGAPCQCKEGLVRVLSTGKCIKPDECPQADKRNTTSKKYEKFDIACNRKAFNLTIMSDRTGCFFCEARSCLIVWTLIGVIVNIYAIIDALVLGPRGAGYTTTEIVIAVLSFILMFMLLYGAWKRQASLLKVGFYLVMILMIINLIRLIITAITYRVPPGYGWPYGSVIVSFLTSVVYLALLGWTIQRTLNEVEIRNSYGAFNA